MPHINVRSDMDDRCTCGHVRGEHLTPVGGWHTAYCLITDCHCAKFEPAATDGRAGQPKPAKQVDSRG